MEFWRIFEVSIVFAVNRKVERRLESCTLHVMMSCTWKTASVMLHVMSMRGIPRGISGHGMTSHSRRGMVVYL